MEYRSLTLDDFLSRFQLLRPQINRETLNHRQAAVLIPIVRRPQPGLLLTQRSIHLRKHAGQVAFLEVQSMTRTHPLSPPRCAKLKKRSLYRLPPLRLSACYRPSIASLAIR